MTTNVPDVVRALRERLDALQSGAIPVAPDGSGSTDPEPAADPPVGAENSGSAPEAPPLTEEERAEEQQAKAICLRLLADSARPRAGLEQKLLRRGISPEVTTRVLDRFTDVGLIDDQAYAEAYVRSKHQERALSRRALSAELRRKGLDDTIAVEAVESLDSAAEESRATALIEKRARTALAAGPEAARRRLLALLDRRGYPADMSIRVVESVLGSHDDESAN